MLTFNIGDRVIIAPDAYTRAGQAAEIIYIFEDNAVVRFDDGEEMGYLLDDNELIPIDMPLD